MDRLTKSQIARMVDWPLTKPYPPGLGNRNLLAILRALCGAEQAVVAVQRHAIRLRERKERGTITRAERAELRRLYLGIV